MKVEKIHDRKISVFISILDLKERNINIFEFYPQSSKVQALFLDILEEAYLQQGFETEGSQLFIETKPLPNHGLYISITKFDDEEELEGDYSSGYIIHEVEDFFSNPVEKNIKHELVFSYPTIESIEPCIEFLTQYSFENTCLYQLEKKYILTLVLSNIYKQGVYSKIDAFLAEYGVQKSFSIAYVDEHGKKLLPHDALQGLKTYFNTPS